MVRALAPLNSEKRVVGPHNVVNYEQGAERLEGSIN